MEPRFGHDFSRVRVHTGTLPDASARALDALAYTVGSSVVLRQGVPSASSMEGKRLLAHELAHVVQQSAGKSMIQRQEQGHSSEPAGPQFTCTSEELINVSGDTTESCCSDLPLRTARAQAVIAQQYLDRTIARMAAGQRMDGVLATHFGAAQVSHRSQVLDSLRLVRTTLATFEASGKKYGCRGSDTACPDQDTKALGNHDGILFCGVVAQPPYILTDWPVLLHEMCHVAFPINLPRYGSATPQQQTVGEFETYYDRTGEETDPRWTRYATSASSLINADSYARFVVVVGAESWTAEPAPPTAGLPMPSASTGAVVGSGDIALAARLTETIYGRGLFFVTAGASGLWMPGRGVLPSTDPAASQTRAYVGGNLGLRTIVGSGAFSGIFDLEAGLGARFQRGGGTDVGVLGRVAAGLRLGSASSGVSIGVDLQHVFDFAGATHLDDGWIVGGFLGAHWGGHSGQTR
jgi:hypothetical protein